MQSAQAALARGDFAVARGLCQRLLERDSSDALARYCLGLAFALSDQPDAAIEQWRQVLQQQPRDFPTLVNLGVALSRQGQHEAAIGTLRAALAIDSTPAQVHYNLGNSLLASGDIEGATQSLRAAIGRDPRLSAAHNSLGVVHRRAGRLAEACAEFEAAIAADPACLEALGNLGVALQSTGDDERAVEYLRRALQLDAGYVDVALTLSRTLDRLGRSEEAIATLTRTADAAPGAAEVHHALGIALHRVGRLDAALQSYGRVLALQPASAETWRERAAALESLQQLDEALAGYRRATELAPGDTHAWAGLVSGSARCCDWELADESLQRLRGSPAGLQALHPFLALSLCDQPAEQLQVAAARAATVTAAAGAATWPAASASERIRVAYVSSDLHDHAIAHLLVGLLERHDHERFEIHAVSLQRHGSSAIEARLRRAVHTYHDVSALSDAATVDLLRGLNIDIAVDLNGYTVGARPGIFAARAASVQVSYLGYAGTLGAQYMDYVIADEVVIPPGEDCWYTERVVRLPHCYLPNDDRRAIAPAPERTLAGLPESGFVFCAFSQPYKINRPMFELWMRLLAALPGSILWLKHMPAAAQRNLTQAARRCGVAPERLVFAPHVTSASEHLARHALAQLCLDTLPYNAHSSACDALWAGVPLLTCAGRTFAARAAASALKAVGLSELIVPDLVHYERRALELAREPPQLAALRARLVAAQASSPLFDTVHYTRHLEMAYERMRERVSNGEGPAAFTVAAR